MRESKSVSNINKWTFKKLKSQKSVQKINKNSEIFEAQIIEVL